MSTATPDLTDTHREIQTLAREFAQGEIAPNAARWNLEHHVPVETLRAMGELGFLGIIIPEEYGGAGLDYTCLALVMEEVAAADAGTSTGARGAELAHRRAHRAARHRGPEGGPPAGPGQRRASSAPTGSASRAWDRTPPTCAPRPRPTATDTW